MQVWMQRSLVRPGEPGELVDLPIQSRDPVQGGQHTAPVLSRTSLRNLATASGGLGVVQRVQHYLPHRSACQDETKPKQTRCHSHGQCRLLRSCRSTGNRATVSVLVSIKAGRCRNNGIAPRFVGTTHNLGFDLLCNGDNSNFNARHRVRNWRCSISFLLVLSDRWYRTHSSRSTGGIRTYSSQRKTPRGDHRTNLAFPKTTRR